MVQRVLSGITDYDTPDGDAQVGSKRKHSGGPRRKKEYLMGFTIIPKNMMENGKAFSPLDAFDAATSHSGVCSSYPSTEPIHLNTKH